MLEPKKNLFSKSNLFKYLIFLVSTALIVGNGCSIGHLSSSSLSSTESGKANSGPTGNGTNEIGGGGGGTTAFSTEKYARVSKDEFDTCVGDPANWDSLTSCLNTKSILKDSDIAKFNSHLAECAVDKANRLLISICLATKGFIIVGHRILIQSDINSCFGKVGLANVAACLDKNGVLPTTVTQDDINSCNTNVTIVKVEKCLRKRGLIPKETTLAQPDITLCRRVVGDANTFNCLIDNDLVPAAPASTDMIFVGQFVQTDLNTCFSEGATSGVTTIKCLRDKGKLSKVLMLNHINRCLSLVGQSKLAACLESNGLIPNLPNGTKLAQTDIDTCVSEEGADKLVWCLRWKLGAMNRIASQAEVNECIRLKGATAAASCLSANSLEPADLTQELFDQCTTAVTNNSAVTYAKCFRKKNLLSKTLLQSDVNNCMRLVVDSTKLAGCLNANVDAFLPLLQTDIDTCVTAVTTANVAKCLKNKNLIPTVLMQEHIKGCALFAGQEKIAACLTANGFAAADSTELNQNDINTCITNVGLANVRKCLGNNNILSKTIQTSATAACTLFVGADNVQACYDANGLIP